MECRDHTITGYYHPLFVNRGCVSSVCARMNIICVDHNNPFSLKKSLIKINEVHYRKSSASSSQDITQR